ncbi:MAG: leucyl/phenylalanyl-tRNA--protein transferase [Gaiellales bacterium]
MSPLEPPPSRWLLEAAPADLDHDLHGLGADLEPGTLLAAYRLGLFPMPVTVDGDGGKALGWWSPARRGVIPLDHRLPRTVRRVGGRYEIRVDTAFEAVIRGCGDPSRPHGWIDEAMIAAYGELHTLGWAHSLECWDGDMLAGGLYGVAINGLFAAESMFQRRPDAAKCALAALVERLCAAGDAGERLLDVQWQTPHLALLGATEIARSEYHLRLETALRLPLPELRTAPC